MKGSLDSIPSPSPSVKIKLWAGKFALCVQTKHYWVWVYNVIATHFLTSSRYQVLLLLAIVLKGKDRHTDIAQTNASFETCHEKNESNSQLQNMYCHTSGHN